MTSHSFVLMDVRRVEQFGIIGSSPKLMSAADIHFDGQGLAWAVRRTERHCFAITWPGSNRIFDPAAARQRHREWQSAQDELARTDEAEQQRQLGIVMDKFRVGPRAERLLWYIHSRVLNLRRSVFTVSDAELAGIVWGASRDCWPVHWRREITNLLKALSRLHVATPEAGSLVEWGVSTALLTHTALLLRRADLCQEDCPWYHVSGHRHFLINAGRGFLGVLEQLANESDVPGERIYDFPVGSLRSEGTNLSKLGKDGNVMSAYLPAKVGPPDRCGQLSSSQHRLFQAIVREATRCQLPTFRLEIIQNAQVPDLSGRSSIECDGLVRTDEYVTFGGNKKRKGCGYLLYGEYGWLSKAGYSQDETDVRSFFRDLHAISDALGLVVLGLRKSYHGGVQWLTLDQIDASVSERSYCRWLSEIHLRIYTLADYDERWLNFFQFRSRNVTVVRPLASVVSDVSAALIRHRLTRNELAQGMRKDFSLVCKILNGKRRCSDQFIRDSMAWIERRVGQREPRTPGISTSPNEDMDEELLAVVSHDYPQPTNSCCVDMLSVALDYRRRGWSVVPQAPEAKQPWVKWKPYQERLPEDSEIVEWYRRWPGSGIAIVLGPVSNLFVIDVDGPEAHETLIEHLGQEPIAPKVLSGSGVPHRYHLFFHWPAVAIKAKQTPWHPKLEFRGKGGIVIAPPSLHRSGNRYRWQEGRSLIELELPTVPEGIQEAIRLSRTERQQIVRPAIEVQILDAAASTRAFLAGEFSERPGWNDRLFRAACDLHARNVPREPAEQALLAGARPWDSTEEDTARRTIESAYSEPRAPSQT